MRCYLVKIPGCVRLASTQGEARAYRQAMVDERGVSKKKVELVEYDIATAKPKLLAFINELLEQFDDKSDFVMPGGGGEEAEGEEAGGEDGEE